MKCKHFSKICPENSIFVLIWQTEQLLHMTTNIHFWSYLAEFSLEWGILCQVVETIKIEILYSVTFCENHAVYEICGKILYSQTKKYSARSLHAGYRRLQTHTQNSWYLSFFFLLLQLLNENASILSYLYFPYLVISIQMSVNISKRKDILQKVPWTVCRRYYQAK